VSLNTLVAESLYQEDIYLIPGKTVILIPIEWGAVSPEDRNTLSKILAAVKLKLEMVQIISVAAVSVEKLLPFSPARVISFGVNLQPEVKPYDTTVLNDIKVIYADAIPALDDQKKRNLWLALRVMFGI
jgi:hypothetical protein